MGTVRSLYTDNQSVTITLASLANGATALSSVVDNSSSLFITADIQIKFTTTSGTISSGTVALYLVRSVDGGTTFDDAPTNGQLIGSWIANTDSTTFIASTDTALSGQLPDFFKLAVTNGSGAAFDATAANFYLKFLGKQFEVV